MDIPPLEDLIPHRDPMLLLDRLVAGDEKHAEAVKTYSGQDYGVDMGRVVEVALIEGLAQTVSALKGYQGHITGIPPGLGMLVGVEKFTVNHLPELGKEVEFTVDITRQRGPVLIVEGVVRQGGDVLAAGKLKLFIQKEEVSDAK